MTRLDKGKSNLVVEIDFDYDVDTDKVEPRSSTEFLKRIEDNCGDFPDKDMKLEVIWNKVLEKMKRTLRRERKLSVSGSDCSVTSRSSSKTRPRSESEEVESELAAKISRHSNLKPVNQLSKLRAPSPSNQAQK